MEITNDDMTSRQRMARLQSLLSDQLGEVPGITYGELLVVLGGLTQRWAEVLRHEELKEE